MNSEHARSLIARAVQTLDHVEGKNKTDRRAVDIVRQLLTDAERELGETESSETLPIPTGAREGISSVPRAEWRRR